MARMETSQQIDLQQGTVYSLQKKGLGKGKSLLEEGSAIQSVHQSHRHLMPLHYVHVYSIPCL